jgi:hypothetical protein
MDLNTTTQGESPIVALPQIEKETKINKANEEEAKRKLELEKTQLKEIVQRTNNPNPVFVAIVFVGVVLVFVLLYIFLIKPNASGKWYDSDGNLWTLHHYALTETLTVEGEGSVPHAEYISGNVVRMGKRAGIWDYNDVILFVDGTNLVRVKS